MQALKDRVRLVRELREEKEKATLQHQMMVEEMLEELCRQNPEWEARRKSVQRVSTWSCLSDSVVFTEAVHNPQLKTERAKKAKGLRQTQTRSS
jgi:hypothetical protein